MWVSQSIFVFLIILFVLNLFLFMSFVFYIIIAPLFLCLAVTAFMAVVKHINKLNRTILKYKTLGVFVSVIQTC
jgi:hypothetical protein